MFEIIVVTIVISFTIGYFVGILMEKKYSDEKVKQMKEITEDFLKR